MKRKIICLAVSCMLLLLSVKGQHAAKPSGALKFQSNLQSGILVGQKGSQPAMVFSAVNGFQSKTWFGGLGVGLDYYGEKRTAPLFFDVQKELSARRNTWFGYANIGYNMPWLMNDQKQQYAQKYRVIGGVYYEMGGGYKFTIFTKTRLGLSAGYTYKNLKEKYTPPCVWCEWQVPGEQITKYDFRRIALKLNWWLQ